MSGLWDTVKQQTFRTKLRGDLVLMEREANVRKKKLGVDLYDLLTKDKQNMLSMAAGTIFEGQQMELKDPFDRSRNDVDAIQARKDVKQRELDVLEVKGAHTMPDVTVNDKLKKARKAVTNAGVATKLRAEMTLMDREMKIRKEEFGVEVFDLLQASEDSKKKTGIKATVSGAISKISDQEKAIQACIDQAKQDVLSIGRRQNFAQSEIRAIDMESES